MLDKGLLLDTSFIMDWFENAVKAYRRSPEEYENGEFDSTKKMEFLTEAKYELFTTDVAQAEVFRKLFSEKTVEAKLCERVWEDFIRRFSITVLKVEGTNFGEIAKLCLVTPLKRGSIPNLVQLQFTKSRNLLFVTGDNVIKDNYKHYYEKIYTYINLRKLHDAEKSGQSI